jgi:hypothetical protein
MRSCFAFVLLLLLSCSETSISSQIPFTEERAVVQSTPVLEYYETVGDTLNPDWKFKVDLYEQKQSLNYQVRFQYKEIQGEKIFTYPNFGFMPKPGLRKGPKPFSCIVGFYDADSVFKELRLIEVDKERLVYRHLKEYQVQK